jgi:hypothetical protein
VNTVAELDALRTALDLEELLRVEAQGESVRGYGDALQAAHRAHQARCVELARVLVQKADT